MSAACLTKGGGLSCPRQVMQEGCIRGLLHQAQTGRAYAPIVESPPCDQNLRVLELVAATLLNSTVGPGSGAEESGCSLADPTTESGEREESRKSDALAWLQPDECTHFGTSTVKPLDLFPSRRVSRAQMAWQRSVACPG